MLRPLVRRGVLEAKGKRLVRRTTLLFGTMLVLLVVAAGVAFARVNCDTYGNCNCTAGVLCEGTNDRYGDYIYGTNSGDTIYAYGGPDAIWGYGGNDYIVAGSGNDDIEGGPGYDRCDGGSGEDIGWTINGVPECERHVRIEVWKEL